MPFSYDQTSFFFFLQLPILKLFYFLSVFFLLVNFRSCQSATRSIPPTHSPTCTELKSTHKKEGEGIRWKLKLEKRKFWKSFHVDFLLPLWNEWERNKPKKLSNISIYFQMYFFHFSMIFNLFFLLMDLFLSFFLSFDFHVFYLISYCKKLMHLAVDSIIKL